MKSIPHYYHDRETGALREWTSQSEVPIPDSHGEKQLALFDRDGVFNEKAPAHTYITHHSQLAVYPEALESIRRLNEKQIPVILVSNQPSIGKGLATFDDIREVNEKLQNECAKFGASIDAVFLCPHVKGATPELSCPCRKPQSFLLETALRLFGGSKDLSYYFGDFFSDIEAAARAGVQGVYIETHHDEHPEHSQKIQEKFPQVWNSFRFPNVQTAIEKLFP